MAFAMKQNETPNPLHIHFFRTHTVPPRPQSVACLG
jgi:hypothetical protein